jgi:hypothetical protein
LHRVWTKRRVLVAIRLRAAQHRSLVETHVYREDSGLVCAAIRHLGGWYEAVRKAGFANETPRGHGPKPTPKAEILQALLRHLRDGGDPSALSLERRGLARWARLARVRFGSVYDAFVAAGQRPPRRHRTWTAEAVVRALRAHAARGGSLCYSRAYRQDCGLACAAGRYHGGWDRAVRAAGLEPDRRRNTRSAAAILAALREAARLGLPLTRESVDRRTRGLSTDACKRFGNWRLALVNAGVYREYLRRPKRSGPWRDTDAQGRRRCRLCPTYHYDLEEHLRLSHRLPRRKYERRHGAFPPRRWTREAVVAALRAYRARGERACDSELKARDWALMGAARKQFGSVTRAFVAAGITPEPLPRGWTRARVREEIRRRMQRGDSLRPADCAALYVLACRRFGAWAFALRAAART